MVFLDTSGRRTVNAYGKTTDTADGMEMELRGGRMVMRKGKWV